MAPPACRQGARPAPSGKGWRASRAPASRLIGLDRMSPVRQGLAKQVSMNVNVSFPFSTTIVVPGAMLLLAANNRKRIVFWLREPAVVSWFGLTSPFLRPGLPCSDRNAAPKASLTAASTSTVRKFRDLIGAQIRNLDNGKILSKSLYGPLCPALLCCSRAFSPARQRTQQPPLTH